MPKVEVNDAEFYYEMHGKGDPIVLISGYTCDHSYWEPVLGKLAQTFQVLIFDNRAVGQTKDKGSVLSAEMMADDVIALSDKLGLKKPHIVGQSMGGTIAQKIGIKYGSKIHKLAILSSPPKWRKAMLVATQTLLAMREKNVPFDVLYDMTTAWCFGEDALQNTEQLARDKENILNDPHPQSIEDQKRQWVVLDTFDAREQLKTISVPTLVYCGKEDIITLPSEAREVAKRIPQAQYVEGAKGHNCIEEAGDVVADLLVQFCK